METIRTVYKYPLPISNAPTAIRLDPTAVFRHVGQQDDPRSLALWFETRPDDDPTWPERTFYVFGTGALFTQPGPEEDSARFEFLGTVQTESGYTWHVYMRTHN